MTGVAGQTGSAGATGATGATGAAGVAGLAGIGFGGQSMTSLTLSQGMIGVNQSFTTQSLLGYIAGQRVRAASAVNQGASYLEGVVASYSGTTLVITPDTVAGTNTVANWCFGESGLVGTPGAAGAAGATGATGATGPVGLIGLTGTAGPTGPTGGSAAGVVGATGPAGATGPSGASGPTGPGVPYLNTNVSYYVATTGNDSTGDGSSSNPWATIGKALTVVNGFYISPNGSVTIYLGNGTFTASAGYTVNHPNGDRIFITGTNTYTTPLNGALTNVGTPSGGVMAVTLAVASTANVAVNDYVIINNVAGGSYAYSLDGCHKVTGVGTGTITLAIKSYCLAAQIPSGSPTATVNIIKTVLTFTSATNAIVVGNNNINYNLGGLSNLVIVGQVVGGAGVCGGNVYCNLVGVQGFAYGFYACYGSRHYLNNCAGSGNQIGFLAYQGTMILTGTTIANGNSAQGMVSEWSATINSIGGVSYVIGNNGYGAYAQCNSSMSFPAGGYAFYNTSHGIIAWQNSQIYIPSGSSNANGGNGIYANQLSTIQAPSFNSQGNTGWGIYASDYSTVLATGGTISGNTAGQESPAANAALSTATPSFMSEVII